MSAEDRAFLGWLHTQPCTVAGTPGSPCFGRITVHHLMRYGERRNHRRAMPLCLGHHERDWGRDSFERLRWRGFERRFGIDIEQVIAGLNAQFVGLGDTCLKSFGMKIEGSAI